MPVPPREANPAIPPGFEAIVLQAMAKDPSMRYQTADELRTDQNRFRQGRQVAAVPPPPPTAAVTQAVQATQALAATGPATTMSSAAEPAHKRTGLYVVLLFVMLIALAGLLYALAKTVGIGGGGGTTSKLAVPNVIGKTVTDAEGILTNAGFKTQRTYEANAADKDVVFDQDPKPGDTLAKGSMITLHVSQGQQPVRVPRVVGLKQQDAEDELVNQGFKIGTVDQQNSDTVAAGVVLSQDPKSGDSAPQGTSVNLVVSSGKEQVTIPDESGKDASGAANDLGRLGLQTTTTQEASSTVATGKVIRTDPPANTSVDKGSTVTLVVSSGPKQVTVPSVVGMTEQEATSTLQNQGFKVNSQSQSTTNPNDNGRVLAQNPNGGTQADQGSTVTITVGKTSGSSSTTSTT
jgi:beta-lactam-binding protein with PASTA domain